MEKLLENSYIKRFTGILDVQGYVQITNESLGIRGSILRKVRQYNEGKRREDWISLNKEKTKIVSTKHQKNLGSDDPLVSDLRVLLNLKAVFSAMGIEEGSFRKKREAVVDALCRETHRDIKIHHQLRDLLYDTERVSIMRITSLKEYHTKYGKVQAPENNIYFRGQSNSNWTVKPSIFRGKWINHEKDFIEEMIMRNPADFEHCRTTIEKLTKMQHYNAPTRLLDLTKNRLIALFFACEKGQAETGKPQGEVIMFYDKADPPYYYDSDEVSILANIAMMDTNFCIKSKKLTKLQYQIQQERPNFEAIQDASLLHQCLFTHVKLDNKRIMNQQGLFLLVGAGADRLQPADMDPYFLKDEDHKKLVFIIPHKNKPAILKELAELNIHQGFMYPEIDHVAAYLKNDLFKF